MFSEFIIGAMMNVAVIVVMSITDAMIRGIMAAYYYNVLIRHTLGPCLRACYRGTQLLGCVRDLYPGHDL